MTGVQQPVERRERKAADRQRTAMRLLVSSAHSSFDPAEDLDWAADLEPDLPCLPLRRVSLYGTELWRGLTPEQQVELAKHEMSSIMQVGLWFELILMQMLLRYSYDLDIRTAHAQYALTEIGDETRHSVMFARAAEKLGTPRYTASPWLHTLGRIYKATAGGPAMFAPVLVAEELTDRLQREIMADEGAQPLIRGTSQIHVVEEARHVRYAREELVRMMPGLNRRRRARQRVVVALVSYLLTNALIDPRVYESVGIAPKTGRAAALANPHHQQTRRWMAEKVMPFLTEVGIVGGPSTVLYRKAFLI
ncbi:MAG TPA: diiron oxygenase [Jatrophihabitans sp.]|nr:diiron oxygenase [Jatrophihabitans sp.]